MREPTPVPTPVPTPTRPACHGGGDAQARAHAHTCSWDPELLTLVRGPQRASNGRAGLPCHLLGPGSG